MKSHEKGPITKEHMYIATHTHLNFNIPVITLLTAVTQEASLPLNALQSVRHSHF